jgi:hypothetical protein
MSKKNADREKEEEKGRDEEDEDEDLDEEDEDEDEHHAGAKSTSSKRASSASHDHDDDEEEEDAEEDPFWWTPHAVMSALVLIGVLGFFGVFNKVLGKIVPPVPVVAAATHDAKTEAKHEAKAERTPPKAPDTREEFGAKHLLVQYKGAMRAAPTITRTEDEAKARATEAMKKAKSGTKFEDVVKEYSDEPGAGARGGDLGKFKKGMMVPDFQTAVEKLKVGEISDLVKTPFGFHVILRTQ